MNALSCAKLTHCCVFNILPCAKVPQSCVSLARCGVSSAQDCAILPQDDAGVPQCGVSFPQHCLTFARDFLNVDKDWVNLAIKSIGNAFLCKKNTKAERRCSNFGHFLSFIRNYREKLSPQPQVLLALGLLKIKPLPFSPPEYSRVVPTR